MGGLSIAFFDSCQQWCSARMNTSGVQEIARSRRERDARNRTIAHSGNPGGGNDNSAAVRMEGRMY